MPVPVNSQIIRRNNADFELLDDNDVTGGYKVVSSLTALNNLQNLPSLLKLGGVAYVQSTLTEYRLTNTSPYTWTPLANGSFNGVFYWTLAKTWAQVYAEASIIGFGIIFIQGETTNIPRQIPAGAYNLNTFRLVGIGDFSNASIKVNMAANVTIDDSLGNVNLDLEHILLTINGTPIQASPQVGSEIDIRLNYATISRVGANAPSLAIYNASVANNIFMYNLSAFLATDATNPLFTSVGHTSCVVRIFDGSVINKTLIDGNDVTGIVVVQGDSNTGESVFLNNLIKTLIFSGTLFPNSMSRNTFAGLPAPSGANMGEIRYDTTNNRLTGSNGVSWAGLISGTLTAGRIPYSVSVGGLLDSSNLLWNNGTSTLTVLGTVVNTINSGIQQNISNSGAIAINSQLGETVVLTSTGNITGLTISGGQPGQRLILEMVQGNVLHTWVSNITNVRLIGGIFTKSTASGAVDVIQLAYNSATTTWDQAAPMAVAIS